MNQKIMISLFIHGIIGNQADKALSRIGTGAVSYTHLSEDLVNWSGKEMCYVRQPDSWCVDCFWAPEVVFYEGKYYMFYTAKNQQDSLRIEMCIRDRGISTHYGQRHIEKGPNPYVKKRIFKPDQNAVILKDEPVACLLYTSSAYSDMAIGMGWMLGFHFPENFRYPLSSVSVTDFWRRWHISLSTWFRDYVYIPLGGNRKGVARHLRNMLIVWFLTGLWHGAAWNFVLWGLYYGLLLALEKYVWGRRLERLPAIVQHAYTLLIVVFGFVIFVFDDMGALGLYLRSMAACAGNSWWGEEFLWYVSNYGAVLFAAVLLAFPVYPWMKRKMSSLGSVGGAALRAVSLAGYVLLFLLTTAFLVNDTYNPFLYFRF